MGQADRDSQACTWKDKVSCPSILGQIVRDPRATQSPHARHLDADGKVKSARWDTRQSTRRGSVGVRSAECRVQRADATAHSPAIEVSSAVKPGALAADEPPPLPAAPCRRPSIRTPRVRVQVIPPLAPLLFFSCPAICCACKWRCRCVI